MREPGDHARDVTGLTRDRLADQYRERADRTMAAVNANRHRVPSILADGPSFSPSYTSPTHLTPSQSSPAHPAPAPAPVSPTASYSPVQYHRRASNERRQASYVSSEHDYADTTPQSYVRDSGHVGPRNIFDATMPRWLLMRLIDAHWRVTWPLYPFLHRAKTMQDLARGRETLDSDPEWAYMILAMVACTIMWLPCPFLPVPGPEARRLVDVIGDQVKAYLAQPWEYEEASLTRCE